MSIGWKAFQAVRASNVRVHCICVMSGLAYYLMVRESDGMNYPDAVQLCLRLYRTVDGVPKQLLPLSKETLADVFAELGGVGWVQGGNLHDVSTRGHWLGCIGAIFKKGADVVDMARGEALACRLGFVTERGVS